MTGDLVFDLGMNNGDDTDYYLRKGFRVVAVEANPDLHALGMQRFAADVQSGRLHMINAAISKSSGQIELFINEATTGWTTTNPLWLDTRIALGTKARSVVVPAITSQEIVREFGVPYFIKADIQGAEPFVLEALLEFDERPKFISISSGTDVVGAGVLQHVRNVMKLFSDLGYRKFKIIQQRDIELQKCPFPAREGSHVDYLFKHGQSGLFGEELPGEWMDQRQILREYRKIVMGYRLAGSSHSPLAWFNKIPSWRVRHILDRLFWRGIGWYDTHAKHGA